MRSFIAATLLTSKEAEPQSTPFEIYDSRLRLQIANTTYWGAIVLRASGAIVETCWVRWVRLRRRKRGSGVGRSSEMSRLNSIHCTLSAE
jgi:hypothetical protein